MDNSVINRNCGIAASQTASRRKFLAVVLCTLAMLLSLLAFRPVKALAESGDAGASDGSGAGGSAGAYNMLLIGTDRRDSSWNGNSDSMILVTVNDERETIYMTSFLRDLYADIPGVGVRKLNNAFAVGGADLCMETIKANYGVEIDNYALVDFYELIKIVDVCGGIDLELTEQEVNTANGYADCMAADADEPYTGQPITGSGLVHLDGYHAVAYARDRFSGSENDFGRTDRQRIVLKALLAKLKEADMNTLLDVAAEIISTLETDVNAFSMMALLAKLPVWIKYPIEEQKVPFEGSYHSENEILIPNDMEATRAQIREKIY